LTCPDGFESNPREMSDRFFYLRRGGHFKNLVKNPILILIAAVGLLSTTCYAQAQFGWTLDQWVRHYTESKLLIDEGPAYTVYEFSSPDYNVVTDFKQGKVFRLFYEPIFSSTPTVITQAEAVRLIKETTPGAVWSDSFSDATSIYWSGSINGKPTYSAWLRENQRLDIRINEGNPSIGGVE
jgi:hypothetical protein